jgi:hypothetical protein
MVNIIWNNGEDDMKSHTKFAAWWVSVLLTVTGVFWAAYFGMVQKIWEVDETMITSIIVIVFVACNIILGVVARQVDRPFVVSRSVLQEKIKSRLQTVWFASEQIMALGMLGTVIGLVLMLTSNSVGGMSQGSMQSALGDMWTHMGLALYTNAVGLVCSIVLKVQVYLVGYGVDET